jgi:Iap family predicted aminopeptidase
VRRIAARALLLLALMAPAMGAVCNSERDRAPQPPPRITAQALVGHLAALERIAQREGGDRAAGTPGYAASVAYVRSVLRAAGWRVRVQRVPMAVWRERSPATLVLEDAGALEPVRDFRVPSYAGAGRADGPLRVVGDACDASDFAELAPGEVALTSIGGCLLWRKTLAARRAGAGGLLVQTATSGRGVTSATLAVPRIGLPVALIDRKVALRSGERVQLSVDAVTEPGATRNVIAESGPRRGPVVVAGAHLDSVPGGPGVNDNGSGVATLLEVAATLGGREPGRIRLAFWGAEEEGLIGSRHYVRGLSTEQRRAIAAYLNLDMVGSPNAVPAVYSDGAPRLANLLRRVYPGRERGVLTGNRSDHAPFESAGVPVNGLYTGAGERGPGGGRRDPCYHLPCDTLANVDRAELLRMARAAARALARLARG